MDQIARTEKLSTAPSVPPKRRLPPWMAMIVGFLFIDGLLGMPAFLLKLFTGGNPLFLFPPFSFVGWYAWQDTWGWLGAIVSFLRDFTPTLELACAYAIRRDPSRLRRLVTIVAVSKALIGLGRVLGQYWVWHFGGVVAGLAEILLSTIAIAIVRRWMRPDRPAVSLVSSYLILTALGPLGGHVETLWRDGIGMFRYFFQPFFSWSYALVECPVVDVVSVVLVMICGVLLLRQRRSVKAIGVVLVIASFGEPAMVCLGYATIYAWHTPAWHNIPVIWPHIAKLVITVAMVRLLFRNRKLFAPLGPACRQCGYNLTGNVSGVCPECGVPILAERANEGASPG